MKEKRDNSLEVFEKRTNWTGSYEKHCSGDDRYAYVLIYNLADTFFIGQTKDAFMVASVSLVTPAFFLFMVLGTVFGIGGTSVISRAMGAATLTLIINMSR